MEFISITLMHFQTCRIERALFFAPREECNGAGVRNDAEVSPAAITSVSVESRQSGGTMTSRPTAIASETQTQTASQASALFASNSVRRIGPTD